jgi:hypothetical protein
MKKYEGKLKRMDRLNAEFKELAASSILEDAGCDMQCAT